MTGAGKPIDGDHAELLREIQRLARESGQLLAAMYAAGGDARANPELIARITQVDRQRDLTEIDAGAAGVPREWIDHVRALGQRGLEWQDTRPLPRAARRGKPQRRHPSRIAADTEQLKDTAALHAVYVHRCHAAGRVPEPGAAQQLLRNMDALWMRAGRTAHTLNLPEQRLRSLWTISAKEWRHRVEHYLTARSVDELDVHWNTHADPRIAATARRSLKRLARNGFHGPGVPLPPVMPPHPRHMLAEAHTAVAASAEGEAVIGADTAIDVLLADVSPLDGATAPTPDHHALPDPPGAGSEP
ncbi:hypothetical protein ACWDSJ_26185 [Nocardia sp. NPDC003482]